MLWLGLNPRSIPAPRATAAAIGAAFGCGWARSGRPVPAAPGIRPRSLSTRHRVDRRRTGAQGARDSPAWRTRQCEGYRDARMAVAPRAFCRCNGRTAAEQERIRSPRLTSTRAPNSLSRVGSARSRTRTFTALRPRDLKDEIESPMSRCRNASRCPAWKGAPRCARSAPRKCGVVGAVLGAPPRGTSRSGTQLSGPYHAAVTETSSSAPCHSRADRGMVAEWLKRRFAK